MYMYGVIRTIPLYAKLRVPRLTDEPLYNFVSLRYGVYTVTSNTD